MHPRSSTGPVVVKYREGYSRILGGEEEKGKDSGSADGRVRVEGMRVGAVVEKAGGESTCGYAADNNRVRNVEVALYIMTAIYYRPCRERGLTNTP